MMLAQNSYARFDRTVNGENHERLKKPLAQDTSRLSTVP
jgi:hypothetical protein